MAIIKTKHFNCWRQYLCMVFGQLTHRESISDTILCLKANSNKLYHLGKVEVVAKSTLSTAMKIVIGEFPLILPGF